MVPMSDSREQGKILIVDDEWESPIVVAVRRKLESEGWRTLAVEPEAPWLLADEFETEALYAIEEEQPLRDR